MKLPLFGWVWESKLQRRIRTARFKPVGPSATLPEPPTPTGPPPEAHAPVALPVVPAPKPPAVNTILCPSCHRKVTAWRTYADGRKLCLACSSSVA